MNTFSGYKVEIVVISAWLIFCKSNYGVHDIRYVSFDNWLIVIRKL